MFKLNLKIAWRNLLKNKVYAAINIGGLSLGLTGVVLILLYVNFEQSYDSWSPELKNVYQIREKHDFFTPDNQPHWQEYISTRIVNAVKDKVPQIEQFTKFDKNDPDKRISLKVDHSKALIVNNVKDADSNFFQVLPYKFLQGDAQSALMNPLSIVLRESLAKKLFGSENVLGKEIKIAQWSGDKGKTLTVTGVVADSDLPESIDFSAIMRTGYFDMDPKHPGVLNFSVIYAKIKPNADIEILNENLLKVYTDYKMQSLSGRNLKFEDVYKDGNIPAIKAIPINEVHSNPALSTSWVDKLKPIIGISIFLLLVSIINFINLSTAQTVQRAKEVGVKKVLGTEKKLLRFQFIVESAIQCLIALFVTIILVELLLPTFNAQFDVELTFWKNPQLMQVILQLVTLFLVVTLLAGIYPAWILSNYNPITVLKGSYGNSLKGVAIRNVLVVFQFVISITFIIAIGVMYLQTSFMNNKDIGFERSQLINIKTNYETNFVERIKRIPGVKYVATSTHVLGESFNVPQEVVYMDKKVNLNSVTVTMDALPALGVNVIEGRIFDPVYKQDSVNTVVLNESAARLLDKKVVGKTFKTMYNNGEFDQFQIVGVIKDYHTDGFEKEVLPTLYKVTHLGGMSSTNNLLVKFDSNHENDVIKKIEAEWNNLYPDYPIYYNSMQDTFNGLLKDDAKFMNMVLLFSFLSVTLSLLGLFALSTFVAQRKTKEIAVRKVLGASYFQILNQLNRSFLILVLIANIIAWPITFVLLNKYLQSFHYRIDMPVIPYVFASLLSIVISLVTVSFQARKAALSNPVNALKYE